VPIVLKSGSLNLLEPSGPVQACNGIALPFTFTFIYLSVSYDFLYSKRLIATYTTVTAQNS